MSGTEEFLECPKCKSKTPACEPHCLGCGYEFKTGKEGAGPFTFAFPIVESAYKPSGKETLSGDILMLAIGLLVGIVGGALLSFLQVAIGIIGYVVMRMLPIGLLGWFFLGVMLFFAPFALSYLILLGVKKGALIGKCRNEKTIKAILLTSGLVSYITYVAVYLSIFGFELSNYVVCGISFLCITLPLLIYYKDILKENIFCEVCEIPMKKIKLGKVPIRYEKTLMENLNSRDFKNLVNLVFSTSSKEDKNYSEVSVEYCGSCRREGIINVETTLTRYEYQKDGTKEGKTEKRLIFSSPLEEHEVELILNETAGTPFLEAFKKAFKNVSLSFMQ